jgi:hypothetical protein
VLSIEDLKRHWLVHVQSERYIETQSIEDLEIGIGPTLVDKETGRLTHLSCALSAASYEEMCDGGCFDFENPDIVISAVHDIDEAAALLAALRVAYELTEVVSGDTFRKREGYTVGQLRAHLRRLPCRLNIGSLLHRNWAALPALRASGSIDFRLEENAGFVNPLPWPRSALPDAL